MQYTCAVKNLEFHAYHGLYDEEKLTGGKFLVDIAVESARPAGDTMDRLEDLVNYEKLYAIAADAMAVREDLVEKAAAKMIDAVKNAFPAVSMIRVAVTKCNPAGVFKTGQAVVELVYKG